MAAEYFWEKLNLERYFGVHAGASKEGSYLMHRTQEQTGGSRIPLRKCQQKVSFYF